MTPFGNEIWLVDGPAVTGAAGFEFPTRMVVIRLPREGMLWIWSPVALTTDIRQALDALGTVGHLIAPNSLHYMFLAEWAAAYPEACIHGAPGLSQDVAGTTFHSTLGDDPDSAWADVLEQVVIHGNRITTEVVFFHRVSGTVLVTDLVQQMPRDWFSGWRAVVAKLDLMTASKPSVPRKFRLATTDKVAAREGVQRILEWPAERLVFAHGAPVASGARDVLKSAFAWLMR